MRNRAMMVVIAWTAGCAWLGCNALLGNESAVFEPDGGAGLDEAGADAQIGDDDASTSDVVDTDAGDAGVHPCASTAADPFNCGACGHDCLGGACTSGRCQPVIVASKAGVPTALALDATHVYWTNPPTASIRRAPIAGGAAETIFTAPAGKLLGESLVRRGADLYFTIDDADGGVYRCPATGCGVAAPEPVLAPLESPQFVGVTDGGVLFFSEATFAGRIGRCTLPCDGSVDVIASTEGFPKFVASEGDSFYWSTLIPNGGNLRGRASGTPAAVDLVTGQTVQQVEVHGSDVVFAIRGVGVRAVDRDGGAARAIYAQATQTQHFALDGDEVYFTDNSTLGGVFRCPVTGCGPAAPVVAAGQDHPNAVLVDDKSVYWANAGNPVGNEIDGAILRVAK